MSSVAVPSKIILNVGWDPPLLATRAQVLRSAGYVVESAFSIVEAIRYFRSGDFDLVVLCHSVSADDREQIVSLIRRDGSATPVLCIVSDPASGSRASSFYVFLSKGEPGELIRTIGDTLKRTKVTPIRAASKSLYDE